MREFHLDDFPKDKVYVFLYKQFRKSFFRKVKEKFVTWQKIADFLGISRVVVTNYSKGERYVPLWVLNELSKKINLSLKEIEKHVLTYRPYHGKAVKKPKFPIKETPVLINIFCHLIGDGFATLEKRITCNYTNTEHTLTNKVKNNILQVFGEINLKETRDKRFDAWVLRIPKIIIYLIAHFYRTDFKIPRLPKILWDLPLEFTASVLGAFIEDEGHIAAAYIDISSSELLLLQDIKDLLIMKFKFKPELLRIVPGTSCYHLKINSSCFVQIFNSVKISHPSRYADLIFQINRIKEIPYHISWPRGATREKVLLILSKQPLTAKQLSRMTNLSRDAVCWHLKRLLNENLVKFSKTKHGAKLWNIRR